MSSLSTNSTWENLQSLRTSLSGLGNHQYRYFLEDWKRILDTVDGGEREVKERGTEYLPKTSGQKANKQSGPEVYEAYKNRSVFYGYSKDTLIAMLGIMHSKPAKIELPPAIAELNKEADNPEGWRVGLNQILKEINRNQLTYGRYGILVDMPDQAQASMVAIPKLLQYESFFILDWGTRELANGDIILDRLLLAEIKEPESRGINYDDPEIVLRVLALDAMGNYYSMIVDEENDRDTLDALSNIDLDNPPDDAVYPIANGDYLPFIPFVFCNVSDLHPDIKKSPLLQLANMDISIYRGDADWAQAYFLQGQATPVVSGVSNEVDELLLGAGGFLKLTQPEAKAYYMEVSGDGLAEMRERQQALQKFATSIGISLVDQAQPESGVALETRVGIKSAPLSVVADTGAKALTQALRYANYWKTGDFGIDSIIVEPNKDFSTSTKTAKELLDLWSAKMSGAPISTQDVHKWARDNNFSVKSFEETLTDLGEE